MQPLNSMPILAVPATIILPAIFVVPVAVVSRVELSRFEPPQEATPPAPHFRSVPLPGTPLDVSEPTHGVPHPPTDPNSAQSPPSEAVPTDCHMSQARTTRTSPGPVVIPEVLPTPTRHNSPQRYRPWCESPTQSPERCTPHCQAYLAPEYPTYERYSSSPNESTRSSPRRAGR